MKRFLQTVLLLCAAFAGVARLCSNPRTGAPWTARPPRGDTVPAKSVLTGRCIGIIDGDTVDVVLPDNHSVRVRLEGIDAPEKGQPFGAASKAHLASMVADRQIEVRTTGIDRYGRTLGTIFVGTLPVNLQMVRDGFAWHFVRYSTDRTIATAQVEAQKARRGLWKDPLPTPPWEWRQNR